MTRLLPMDMGRGQAARCGSAHFSRPAEAREGWGRGPFCAPPYHLPAACRQSGAPPDPQAPAAPPWHGRPPAPAAPAACKEGEWGTCEAGEGRGSHRPAGQWEGLKA